MLQDRRDEKFFARNYCDLCYNVIYTENPINLRQEWDRVKELYPKMRRIQFTPEDKEQTETVLNTFFVTDEKTVAEEKKIQILQQDISTEELFEAGEIWLILLFRYQKYLIIILMAAYTFSCFSIFTRSYEDEENKVLIRQDVLYL